MIKKSLRKNIFREIRQTLSRFVAIFAITALGAGFYAGLKATGPDMKATADQYYAQHQLMDWRLLSTMGFTEEDIDALRARPDVEQAMAGYGADMLIEVPDGTEGVRLHSLPDDTSTDNPGYLNRLTLTEGRMPETAGECVADSEAGRSVGEVITLSSLNDEDAMDRMAVHTFTIVGLAESPEYITFTRGNTNIGNGRLSFFLYLPAEAFDSEFYTEVFVKAAGTGALSSFSAEYETLAENGTNSLEDFGKERAQLRYDEIYTEGAQELADARAELADARAEADEKLAEAWQEILDAETELADARAEIADGERKLREARAELDDARRQLEEGQRAYNDGAATYNSGKAQYDAAKAEYDEQRAAYDNGVAQLVLLRQSVAQLSALSDAMNALLPSIGAGNTPEEQEAANQFRGLASTYIDALRQLGAGLLAAGIPQGSDMETAAQDMEGALAVSDYAYAATIAAAVPSQLQPPIADAQAQLDAALPQLNEAAALLAETEAQLADGKATLDSEGAKLANGWAELADGEAELADARAELADARIQLADGEAELADGKAEYEEQKAEAEEKLADAQEEIDDGQLQLDDLEAPEWYVLDRDTNSGYSGFSSDAERIDAIAVVIPVFFFLVAALVCLTTMTRMVEEQRTQIGTLKALGFSKFSIAFKYIFYAGAASFTGGVAGVALGLAVFPPAIWNAYRMMYIMPSLYSANNTVLMVTSIATGVLCTTLATVAACAGELRSVPAELMRPKAPKAGKRVLLERIPALWNRVKFTWKVTIRNLFRYKKRFFMTIIGVAGCTALLLTGFGLRDSITGIVEKQYGSIDLYQMSASLTDPSSAGASTPLNELTGQYGETMYTQLISIDAKKGSATNAGMTTYLYIAEDTATLPRFVSLHQRKTGEPLTLQDSGVIVTEKLADKLGLEVGDSLQIGRPNEAMVEVTVRGITENYIFNYVYITPGAFEQKFGEAPAYDTLLLRLPQQLTATEDEILAALVDCDGVAGAVDIEAMSAHITDLLQSLNAVVWLIILSAGTLAFVVLYNLTNINITERAREIATLKVLGFYPPEVSSYVFRENLMLTLIGIAVGLVLGIFLHDFVITTAEVDEMMFRRVIQPLSYVWAMLFTLLSAVLVNLVMQRRLRKVDMVESLKSAE